MGIQYLNRYIKGECSEAIRQVTMYGLRDKKLAIDASIYMYRFKSEGCLIDGIYQMTMMMRANNIVPVFVFDGNPPQEKIELLNKRREDKKRAELELLSLTGRDGVSGEETRKIISCKKKCVRLTRKDVNNVKQLLFLCGVTFYQADGEADELCAKLVLKNRVWGCVSEDMDLFVYGCPRVLRSFNMFYGTFMLYDMNTILTSLKLSLQEFREICVLSGTDYNMKTSKKINLYIAMKKLLRYKNDKNSNVHFYEWLETQYCDEYDACRLYATEIMFDTTNVAIGKYEKVDPIENKEVHREGLQNFLKHFGFIFL